MAKKRVALVLSGGVSLGSYIAGALDELIGSLALNDDYEIDIITGASAGATTGAIIAYGLMYHDGKTALHDVWVDEADMGRLLVDDLKPGEPVSILSNAYLNDVARRTLSWPNPNVKPVRSKLCAEKLTLAMTITNIEGLSYISRVRMTADGASEPFIQQRYAEQETFAFYPGLPATDPVWERVQQVAIASASLPLVFPPVVLTRSASDVQMEHYQRIQYLLKPEFEGQVEFIYCDGGTFNNLPIDLAARYIKENDQPGDERIVIIVDPSQDHVQSVSMIANATERPLYKSAVPYFFQLLSAMQKESRTVAFNEEIKPRVEAQRRKRADEAAAQGGGGPRPEALPGLSLADVDLLGQVRLVMPKQGDKALLGSYLVYALAAFLDQKFREYDFRRGAVDARRVARNLLHLAKLVERPEGEAYYDADKLWHDLTYYRNLDRIDSSSQPGKNVREVFEDGLKVRIKAIISHLNPPGPQIFDQGYAWFVEQLILPQLPKYWPDPPEPPSA